MKQSRNNPEHVFEAVLWKSRLVVLLAVIFSILGAISLFIAGAYEIWHVITHMIPVGGAGIDIKNLLSGVVGAVDLFLIAIVFMIFGFGVYELFISKIDIAYLDKELNILEIKSLDDLKNRILKVIIMALMVSFFKAILYIDFKTPLEMLMYGLSILAVSFSFQFIHSGDDKH